MSFDLATVLSTGTGVERAFLCPVHGDSRPSASVNVLKGVWFCYTCGAKGTLDSVLVSDTDYFELVENALEKFAVELATPMIYAESWLNLYDSGDIHPYWLTRFGYDAIKHFRLGYDPETISMTYPLRNPSGRVLGVVRRPLEGDGGPKYKYPFGVDIGKLLFNYTPDARRTVYLVEGAMDAVACWEAGVDAFAIYGARISAEQVKLIGRTGATEIVCVFDQDEAGDQAYELVKEMCPDYFVYRMSWDRDLGKDIAELDVPARLDQFEKIRQELVGSDPCESSLRSRHPSMRLRLSGASAPSRTTSMPARLRIVPTKP